jgi:hypothetical protein
MTRNQWSDHTFRLLKKQLGRPWHTSSPRHNGEQRPHLHHQNRPRPLAHAPTHAQDRTSRDRQMSSVPPHCRNRLGRSLWCESLIKQSLKDASRTNQPAHAQFDLTLILIQCIRGALGTPKFQMPLANREPTSFQYLVVAAQPNWMAAYPQRGRFSYHWLQKNSNSPYLVHRHR